MLMTQWKKKQRYQIKIVLYVNLCVFFSNIKMLMGLLKLTFVPRFLFIILEFQWGKDVGDAREINDVSF